MEYLDQVQELSTHSIWGKCAILQAIDFAVIERKESRLLLRPQIYYAEEKTIRYSNFLRKLNNEEYEEEEHASHQTLPKISWCSVCKKRGLDRSKTSFRSLWAVSLTVPNPRRDMNRIDFTQINDTGYKLQPKDWKFYRNTNQFFQNPGLYAILIKVSRNRYLVAMEDLK